MSALSQSPSAIFSPSFPRRPGAPQTASEPSAPTTIVSPRVARRFGPSVDVRNRGVLKAHARPILKANRNYQLAVVRIWQGDDCRELSVTEARAFAAQLIAAAAYAENQNALPGI